ncbi:hypothetical protein DXN05_11900 [Deminuibacter soli]|uniref:Lipoprotein n=2 Tax=Deminuibacter soli TaxID=2291815 RepID=A0A3E1NK76_9BACT|nr:hypothetical protein DXN05_11900 [Deminuibacter soli]
MPALLLTYHACKKDDNNSNPYTPPSQNTTSVQLASTAKFGSILTDSAGRTLYFFAIDANGNSGCTGGCVAAWPVFYKAQPTLAAGLNAADFSTITRTDGTPQTTYKGWPLYYYASDPKAGDINGDGVGGTWFVAKPDYSIMLASQQLTGLDGIQYTSEHVPGQEVTQYFTDAYGRTLYTFSPDKFKKNNFTKADFSNDPVWPMDTLSSIKNVPSLLDKTQFDTLLVFGRVQLTYKGWPLYYFGKDSATRGNTRGVSFPQPGVWPIARKDITIAPM